MDSQECLNEQNKRSSFPHITESGYLAKFDWFVLKPISIGLDIFAIIYFLKHQWLLGIFLIVMGFLVGVVAASLHKNKTTAELAAGHPKLSDAFKKETGSLDSEDSNRIGKATLGLVPILGIVVLVLSFYYKMWWYFAIPLSLLFAWLVPVILSLVFVLSTKIVSKK